MTELTKLSIKDTLSGLRNKKGGTAFSWLANLQFTSLISSTNILFYQ